MTIPIDTVWSLREGTGLGDMGGKGVRSQRAVAQMMLATIIHSSYKHGDTNQEWRFCHDGTTNRDSAEDLLSSYEP